MSEPNGTPEAVGETGAAEPKAPRSPRYRRIAIGLGGALVLVVVLVASAPFWAPLLPWTAAPARIDAPQASGNQPVAPGQPEAPPQGQPQTQLEAQPQKIQQETQPQGQPQEAASAVLQALDRRVGALEARPAAPASDVADIRQQVARLASSAAELDGRVGALEARPIAPASDIADIRERLARLASSATDLDARVASLAKAAPTRDAIDATDMALVLALLQIRGALEAGRPFAAEYEALAALAGTRPEIAAAAAPLAESAKTGVAGRAVLARRLRELAGAITTAKAPANAPADMPADANGGPPPDWVDQALARLRGLVTIRRIDGTARRQPGSGPETVVNAAELALAGGDLESALDALDKLAGPSAEAAGPWLRMARERLAVEVALNQIEALLVARLGSAANAPATTPVNGSATTPVSGSATSPSAVPAGPGSPR
jgi:hypothetical protein